ncbi:MULTISPECIES: prepilin-type N-terminal cleavage/methylation domain-containing protein [Coprobacillaceae]|uniref:prepilin-type N-terminal cleavage/methylation domain-containing protein n=1 Tax=Coprobacillaceae TaxID=2810280 RepID=UPI001F24340E|nr:MULTISPECIES: prepilin-type N-terminal cleavage/methylation domain-containing protein [Coprobacillaceae]
MERMMNKLKDRKGFTLVEIIVVLVILAILAAIAIPSVMGYVDEAKKSQYIQEARSIYLVVQTEEARMRAEDNVESFDVNNNLKSYENLYKHLMDKTTVEEDNTQANPNGEGIASSKTGLPKVLYIYQYPSGDTNVYVFRWKSNDGHIIDANVYKNKKVEIQSIK